MKQQMRFAWAVTSEKRAEAPPVKIELDPETRIRVVHLMAQVLVAVARGQKESGDDR